MKQAPLASITAALLLSALPPDAAAYIDPGTGSLVLQGVIAGLAAGAVAIRSYWYRIKAFFRGDRDASRPTPGTKTEASRPSGDPE